MLKPVVSIGKHLYNSSVEFLLEIVDEVTGLPVTGQTPSIYIRRKSDGFFFDGASFIDTSGVPTALSMSEVGNTAAPGLYSYTFADPGPDTSVSPQLTRDIYQLRFVNSGAPPSGGTTWDVKEFSRDLRDFNTQGA